MHYIESMRLAELTVVHTPKVQNPGFELSLSEWPGALRVETCQRWIWILKSQLLGPCCFHSENVEIYQGHDAYLFLLRLATGLESKILGETDIFGQIKEAWRNFERHGSPLSLDLSPWIQRVFEDTKDIRTQFLTNAGGSSYGTLVRKLIHDLPQAGLDSPPGPRGPVLLVGAGQIARSVAPFLLEDELWIWNRDPERLSAFCLALQADPAARIRKLETGEDEAWGWRNASHVVVLIPMDSLRDSQRIAWFKEGTGRNRSVVHLGGTREQSGSWNSLPNFYSLDDLFSLQNSLGEIRSAQLIRAQSACLERAKLRSLGVSLSIPHGWEDLAIFA